MIPGKHVAPGLSVAPPFLLAALQASCTAEVVCDHVRVDRSRPPGRPDGRRDGPHGRRRDRRPGDLGPGPGPGPRGPRRPGRARPPAASSWPTPSTSSSRAGSRPGRPSSPRPRRGPTHPRRPRCGPRPTPWPSGSTQAYLTARKGTGFLRTEPAQRWARQALFFLVWSCPDPDRPGGDPRPRRALPGLRRTFPLRSPVKTLQSGCPCRGDEIATIGYDVRPPNPARGPDFAGVQNRTDAQEMAMDRLVPLLVNRRDAGREGPGRVRRSPRPRARSRRPRARSPRPRARGCRSRPDCPGTTWTRGSTWRRGRSSVRERVRFTNRSNVPTSELVFHVYPAVTRSQDQDRVDPGQDAGGPPAQPRGGDGHRRGDGWPSPRSASRASRRAFEFDPKDDTIMVVPLGAAGRAGGDGRGRDRLHARPARLLGPLGASQRASPTCSTGIRSSPTTTTAAGSGRRSSPGTSPGTRRRATTRSGSTCPPARSSPRRAGSPAATPAGQGRQRRHDRGQPRARLRPGLLRTGSRPGSGRSAPTLVRVVSFPEHEGNAERILDYACRGHPALRAAGSARTSTTSSRSPRRSSAGTATSARAWSCSTTG